MIKKYCVYDIKGNTLYEGFNKSIAHSICQEYNHNAPCNLIDVIEKDIKDNPNYKSINLIDRVCNDLLDLMCDVRGIKDTIKYLLESGFNRFELLDLNFDKKDIDDVLEEIGDIDLED